MHVLMRKPGESILIGDNTVLTVVGVSGTRVTLGIAVPTSIPILGQEVADELLPMRRVVDNTGRSAAALAALELAR